MIVSSVCLGIAVDDTIHFLSAYHRQRAKGIEHGLSSVFRVSSPHIL